MTTKATQLDFIDAFEARYAALSDGRRVAANAEEALIRSKHALARAERTLDELRLQLQATAPEECKNEVQRKAYAIAASRELADRVDELALEHLENEVRHIHARAYRYGAADLVDFLKQIAQAATLTDVPPLPELPELAAPEAE